MSAIARIGEALSYDAVEMAIMVPGALYSGHVTRVAVAMLDAAEAEAEVMPVSHRPTMPAATVAPRRGL